MKKQIKYTRPAQPDAVVTPTNVSINLESGSVLVYYGKRGSGREDFTLAELEDAVDNGTLTKRQSFREIVLGILAARLGGVIEDVPEPEPEAQPAAADK